MTEHKPAETNASVRKAIALNQYVQNKSSLGYCAQIAGMSKESFIRYLGDHNISIYHYEDEDEFSEELNNA